MTHACDTGALEVLCCGHVEHIGLYCIESFPVCVSSYFGNALLSFYADFTDGTVVYACMGVDQWGTKGGIHEGDTIGNVHPTLILM